MEMNPSDDHFPPISTRYWTRGLTSPSPGPGARVPVSSYEYRELRRIDRHIKCADQDTRPEDRVCVWCGRGWHSEDKEERRSLFGYDPLSWGLWSCVDLWTPNPGVRVPMLWCCSWMCYDRELEYRLIVQQEVEAMEAFRVVPKVIPSWHVLAGLVSPVRRAERARMSGMSVEESR